MAASPRSSEKIRDYATEAVLPFYIIHQTMIVVLGFYVVKWQAGVMVKYLIVVMADVRDYLSAVRDR